jgi:predicted PurR-regulated permease PerM
MILKTKRERTFFLVLMLVVAIGMGVIVFPIVRFIVLGGIAGVLLIPLRRWLEKRTRGRKGVASGLAYVIFVAALLIPIVILLVLSGNQAGNLAESIDTPAGDDLAGWLAQQIGQALGSDPALVARVIIWLRESVAELFATIAQEVAEIVGSAIEFFMGFLLFSFFLIVFVYEFEPLKELLVRLAPLSAEVSTTYLHKTRLMARSVVVGVFGVAAIQTAIMTVTFALVKVPNALAYLIPLFLFSLIPFLGMSLVTIPMGIVLILQGQWAAAIVIWLVHLFVINGVDIVMRPYVISGEVKVNRALLATSFFGGIAVFGMLGLFIGPIFAILFTLSLEVYQDNFLSRRLAEAEGGAS